MSTKALVTLINSSGRPLDDLDILKTHISARDLAPEGASYSVCSADGHPICGFVSAQPTQSVSLVHPKFSAQRA